jgi:hypothetical protein
LNRVQRSRETASIPPSIGCRVLPGRACFGRCSAWSSPGTAKFAGIKLGAETDAVWPAGAAERLFEVRDGSIPPVAGVGAGFCFFPAQDWQKAWCGRRDSNPHERKLNGFSYHPTAFAARTQRVSARQVCGLDYPFTVSRKVWDLGAARLVSTPSRRKAHRAWLGIAISGFPEFEQFCIAGFPDEHSSFLKSVASAISPRPHGRLCIAVYHREAAECTRKLFLLVSAGFPLL